MNKKVSIICLVLLAGCVARQHTMQHSELVHRIVPKNNPNLPPVPPPTSGYVPQTVTNILYLVFPEGVYSNMNWYIESTTDLQHWFCEGLFQDYACGKPLLGSQSEPQRFYRGVGVSWR